MILEKYQIKYAVLMTNAPNLPERLERLCCRAEPDPIPMAAKIEMT